MFWCLKSRPTTFMLLGTINKRHLCDVSVCNFGSLSKHENQYFLNLKYHMVKMDAE